MKDSKAVVINALSRGGSNILWNILQSHPLLCSPIRETGELITQNVVPLLWHLPADKAKQIATWRPIGIVASPYIRRALHQWKLRNFQSPHNGTKYEGVPYTREEVERSILCFKSVDSDIDLNGLLESLYQDVSYVALVRNGYAVCNGWMRRGMSAKSAGKRYASLIRKMLEKQNASNKFVLVKFEEMMHDPFGIARRLFKALDLEPTELPKIRLKAKRVLSNTGEHQTRFGEEGQKYWFGPNEISEILDTDIDRVQKENLDTTSRRAFEEHAKAVLETLGYRE